MGDVIIFIMTKQTIKFGVGALALVLIGWGVLYVVRSYVPEYQARKAYEKLIEEYKNDPYGGDTPEETLQLFIDALKKGDVELASKYYIWDKQEERKSDFIRIKEKGALLEMISDLERAQSRRGRDLGFNWALFNIVNVKNESIGTLSIIFIPGGKWKLKDI